MAALILFLGSGCNGKSLEEQAQDYVSESVGEVTTRLNEELFGSDSGLLDTAAIWKKISESRHLDSLKKYEKQLKSAQERLESKIRKMDSLTSEAGEMLERNL